MTVAEAVDHLEQALVKDRAGRYSFCCKKAFVLVKLHGCPARLRFAAKDKLAFHTDTDCLTVVKRDGGRIRRKLKWEEIECICAGEPEKDDGTLFQG